MQPHELRINNWVKAINPVKHQPYVQLMSTGNNYVDVRCKTIGGVEGYAQAKFGDLEPIPLTPELLEKVGFEWKYNHNEDGDEREWLQSSKYEWLKYYEGHINVDEDAIAHIKYLHQLQNLFYALTGEELNITL